MTQRVIRDEDFALESGLANAFDGAVTDAWFAPPREEYVQRSGGEPTPFLHLKLEGPDLDSPIDQVWSTGSAKQWKAVRDGKEIVSEKNPNLHAFVESSRAGELVGRIITLAGEGDKKKGVQVLKARGYLMTEAEFYLGLNFHWEREKKFTVGGEERDVLMPTVLLGMDATAVSSPKESAYSDADVETVKGLAKGKTEQQFKQQLMRSALKDNKQLLNEVFNGNFMQEHLVKDPSGKFI